MKVRRVGTKDWKTSDNTTYKKEKMRLLLLDSIDLLFNKSKQWKNESFEHRKHRITAKQECIRLKKKNESLEQRQHTLIKQQKYDQEKEKFEKSIRHQNESSEK